MIYAASTPSTEAEARSERLRSEIKQWPLLNTSHWHTVCAATLTMKQAQLLGESGSLIPLDEVQSKKAFRRFIKMLNKAAFGSAGRYGRKRLRVIPVLEKDKSGRWHYHAAIEPPSNMTLEEFTAQLCWCWDRSGWGHQIVDLKFNSHLPCLYALQGKIYSLQGGVYASEGWVKYMLKGRSKSGLETWFDCIDLGNLHNPVADV